MKAAGKTQVGYAQLPIEAQMAIAFAVGLVPISATPVEYFDAGKSWGLITQNGPDTFCLTAYGDRVMHEEIARKDMIAEKIEAQARQKAGDRAGQYLDDLGQTDLAKLTADQWAKFCEHMTTTYLYWRLATK